MLYCLLLSIGHGVLAHPHGLHDEIGSLRRQTYKNKKGVKKYKGREYKGKAKQKGKGYGGQVVKKGSGKFYKKKGKSYKSRKEPGCSKKKCKKKGKIQLFSPT